MTGEPGSEPVYCSAGVEILGSIKLTAEGWIRRTVGVATRIEEMADLYRDLGFETTTSILDPETFGEACTTCAAEACSAYVALYTRRPTDA